MSLLSNTARIISVANAEEGSAAAHLQAHLIRHLLRRFQADQPLFYEEEDQELLSRVPLIRWSCNEGAFPHLSVILLCPQQPHAARFFCEMLSRWLLPGKRLDFSLFFAADFSVPELSDQIYTVAEIAFPLDQEKIAQAMLRNLQLIEMEIRLGIASVYHASRILESKGFSIDEKTTAIQETIASLIRKRSQNFDYDLFSEMQHFLVMCADEFKGIRECRMMCRMICVFYLFRKRLHTLMETVPKKRHLILKLATARLHLPLGAKQVLSLFVGMNFLKENELFEEAHLVAALENYIPGIQAVKDSFFSSRSKEDKIHIFYLEVEKENGASFSLEEKKRLEKGLPEDLKGCVEQLIRPVFMPRNEEEIMRNLLVLSQQVKYVRDIPQMIISFDEQTDTELSFLIILVRSLQKGEPELLEKLQKVDSVLKFHVDKIKNVGRVRKKYPKEASVFRVRFSSAPFLRKDNSVDLYKARQEVCLELQKIFGEMRDYNGGMIAKQIEAFHSLKSKLGELERRHDFLLENFFHAIFPVELRSVLPPDPLKTLFLLLLELMQQGSALKFTLHPEAAYVLFHVQSPSEEEKIMEIPRKLKLMAPQLVTLHLKFLNATYLGYVYFCDDLKKQEMFKNALSLDF